MLKYLCFKSSNVWTGTLILYCLSGGIHPGSYYPCDRIVCMFCTTVQGNIIPDRDILEQLTKYVCYKSMLKIIYNCLKKSQTFTWIMVQILLRVCDYQE